MLSEQRDTCLSTGKQTGVELRGRVGGGLLLRANVLEGENGGVWCWRGWVDITKYVTIISLLVVTVKFVLGQSVFQGDERNRDDDRTYSTEPAQLGPSMVTWRRTGALAPALQGHDA